MNSTSHLHSSHSHYLQVGVAEAKEGAEGIIDMASFLHSNGTHQLQLNHSSFLSIFLSFYLSLFLSFFLFILPLSPFSFLPLLPRLYFDIVSHFNYFSFSRSDCTSLSVPTLCPFIPPPPPLSHPYTPLCAQSLLTT